MIANLVLVGYIVINVCPVIMAFHQTAVLPVNFVTHRAIFVIQKPANVSAHQTLQGQHVRIVLLEPGAMIY